MPLLCCTDVVRRCSTADVLWHGELLIDCIPCACKRCSASLSLRCFVIVCDIVIVETVCVWFVYFCCTTNNLHACAKRKTHATLINVTNTCNIISNQPDANMNHVNDHQPSSDQTEDFRRRMADSDRVSQALATHMLQGWAMLADHCPR